jgi:hypothetical protein
MFYQPQYHLLLENQWVQSGSRLQEAVEWKMGLGCQLHLKYYLPQ